MTDPYVASDGNSYELLAIRGWLGRGHLSSPLSGKPLGSLDITPNSGLRAVTQVRCSRLPCYVTFLKTRCSAQVYSLYCGDLTLLDESFLDQALDKYVKLEAPARPMWSFVPSTSALSNCVGVDHSIGGTVFRRETQLRADLVMDEAVTEAIFGRKQTLSVSRAECDAKESTVRMCFLLPACMVSTKADGVMGGAGNERAPFAPRGRRGHFWVAPPKRRTQNHSCNL
jgi:hypothetical protein